MLNIKVLILIIQLFVIIPTIYGDNSEKNDPVIAIEKERLRYAERMAAYMDTSVDPCKDFYKYACGNFFNVNQVQRDSGHYGNVRILFDSVTNTIHEMLTETVNSTTIKAADKARIYYQSCLNENIFDYKMSKEYLAVVEAMGGWPALNPHWDEEKFNWFHMMTVIKSYGVNAIVEDRTSPMDGLPILGLQQFGLQPFDDLSRPYSRSFRTNRELAKRIMTMYGIPSREAIKVFDEIIELGKDLQAFVEQNKLTESDNDDVEFTLDELTNITSGLPWLDYYSFLYPNDTLESLNVTVYDTNIFKLSDLLKGKNLKRAANYMVLKFLYELHSEIQHPKIKIQFCLKTILNVLKPVVSAMFLNSKHHEKHIEDEILAMTSYIRSAFRDSIQSKTWLEKDTKRTALRKLNNIEVVIGDSHLTLDLEEQDKKLENIEVTPENGFHQNYLNLKKFAVRNDPKRKKMTVVYGVDVNAFYFALENNLIIPAGIFRRPFYYPELPKAYNFAVIGHIIGHEFTHSLDIQGIMIDDEIEYSQWFGEESHLQYMTRAMCFVEQYSEYKVEETNKNVAGFPTLSENISDNGGLRHAFYGYKKWLAANRGSLDVEKQNLPGLNMTDIQLFFLSFAQVYCEKIQGYKPNMDSSADEHTPSRWRPTGALSNFEEFSAAFQCEKDSPLNPEKKCIIW